MMKRLLILLLIVSVSPLAGLEVAEPEWPSLPQQLRADAVAPGSPLEALIAANQDFSLLRPEEARDKIRIPLWLRVIWRRAHPGMIYSAKDPTGGYPFVLKEVHEWMATHPDLVPGPPVADTEDEMGDGEEDLKIAAVAGEKRISGLQVSSRAESDIRVNYWDPMKIIGASNGNGPQAQFYSTNGGLTWGQTTLPLVLGDVVHSDPTVDWTSDGTAWATTIGISSGGTALRMRAYRSFDNGATWIYDATFSGSQTAADKQMMWVDHSPTSPYKDNIYTIWHNGTPAYMSRRTGPNGSWQTPIEVSDPGAWGTAIGGDVKTNAFGDVFGFFPSTGDQEISVVKSTNGGASYSAPVAVATTFHSFDIGIPAFYNRRAFIYVSGGAYRSTTRDMVYASWTDLTGVDGCYWPEDEPGLDVTSPCKTRIWFSRSVNGGATWSAPVMINNQPSRNDQFNQWMVVDETTGALAIIYYDTVRDSGRKKVDVWYQSSFDHGATWSAAVRVTSLQTDETAPEARSNFQFGDYNSLSGIAGQFFPSWTDRRNNAREEIWTAKVTDVACTVPGAPAIGSASAVAANQLRVSWSNGSPAAALFDVYRAPGTCAAPGSFTRIASSVGGSPYADGTVSGGSTYAYRVYGLDAAARCESGPSGCVQATATGVCTFLPSFAGLASVTDQAASICGLSLSWPAAASPCPGAVTYNVYRSTSPGFTPGPGNRIASGVTGTGYTDASDSLVDGTAYYYVVRAVASANGLEESNSVERSATPTGLVTFLLSETFEAAGGFDNPGWTHAALSGPSDWLWTTGEWKSPTHSWVSPNEETVSARVLVSPPFVPEAGTRLSFWHTYLFDYVSGCDDGGTLEVSTDGGSAWSVMPDAAFTAGGFNGTVSSGNSNPLAGKRAWCFGFIDAMTEVTVDLSSFAGSTAQLRWHEGDDASGGGGGWYVDSVTLSKTSACRPNTIFRDGFEGGVLPGPWSGIVP